MLSTYCLIDSTKNYKMGFLWQTQVVATEQHFHRPCARQALFYGFKICPLRRHASSSPSRGRSEVMPEHRKKILFA